MTTSITLDLVYCEGWDPAARAMVGRLGPAAARERNDQGDQYAVALLWPGTRVPHAVIEISWRHGFARAWHFDEHARRNRQIEYRDLGGGHLFVVKIAGWRYDGPDQAEFDEQAERAEHEFRPDGTWTATIRSSGGVRVQHFDGPAEGLTQPIPPFDDVTALAGLETPAEIRESTEPVPAPAAPPWHPPRPLRPNRLDLLFTAGTRYRSPDHGWTATVEVREAGTVRLPSGRLVVTDPGWLKFQKDSLTVPVAPGEYAVRLAIVRFADDPDHVRTAAAKLVIADEPVTTWELALCDGQDPRLLGDGQFYGFGVDAGMGCFVDAEALAAITDIVEEDYEALLGASDEATEVIDPASGANLIAFSSGWGDGSYPIWIGRTHDGRVACFVADMLVVHAAEPVHTDGRTTPVS